MDGIHIIEKNIHICYNSGELDNFESFLNASGHYYDYHGVEKCWRELEKRRWFLSDTPEPITDFFFDLDNGNLMPAVHGNKSDIFEYNSDGDITIKENPDTDAYFELDNLGNIQPKP